MIRVQRAVCEVQGYNLGGVPLLAVGVGKGFAGALLRPGLGVCELSSKAAYGLSLACLGKQGIVGTVQRRVRPPGGAPPPDEMALLDMVRRLGFMKSRPLERRRTNAGL